jgi:hypothetical protein
MAISPRRKRIAFSLGLLLLAGLAWLVWPFIVGPGQMEGFCSSLADGSSPAQVETQAAQHSYRVSSFSEGRAIVHDPRSFGRFTCALQFDAEGLVEATYSFND